MPGRPNNRNYNQQHKQYGQHAQPRGPSPPPLLKAPLTGPDGPDNSEDDPKLNWYYGADAGGFQLTFGKHKGELLKDVPYSYLKWCSENLSRVDVKAAIENYIGGLKQWIADGNFGEVTVPIGRTYKGMPLKKCRDKDWMRWLVQRAPASLRERHELFFLAIKGWLDNPPHQLAKRDIGESLAKSKYYDDMNLDLEEGERFEDDANANGDLAGFVVSDEDEEDEEDEDGDGDNTEEGERGADISEEEEEEEVEGGSAENGTSNQSDDEENTGEPSDAAQSDDESVSDSNAIPPPPRTPLKRKRNVVIDSDSEDKPEYDHTSAYDGSPLERLRRKLTP